VCLFVRNFLCHASTGLPQFPFGFIYGYAGGIGKLLAAVSASDPTDTDECEAS